MLLTIFIILNICVAIYVVLLSQSRLRLRGGKSIFVLSISLSCCYFVYLQNELFPSDITETIKIAGYYLGITLAVISIFTYSLEYTYRSQWVNWITILLLALIPVITQVIFWMPKLFPLIEQKIMVTTSLGSFDLLKQINYLFRFSILTAAIWLLGRTIYIRSGIDNVSLWSILTGPFVAFSTQGFAILGLELNFLEELTLIAITLSTIGFTYYTFRKNSNIALLVRRGSVVEKMEDGWIVLDMENSIVDVNEATAKMTGIPRKKMYGKTITSVFTGFPAMANVLNESQEIEMDRTFLENDEYRYLNIRVSSLQNEANDQIGRLVIWRDITNRRRAEAARQQARDEMFVLLNAISNAASQAANLNKFLSDVIYQIVYPFRSQIIFFYILEDKSSQKGKEEYKLAAHMGLSNEDVSRLGKISSSAPMLNWIDEHNQCLLLEVTEEKKVPEHMRSLNMSCLLGIPLVIQSEEGDKLIGALFMGRKEKPGYKQDEIVRLTILADQIAQLIDSDRRRKLAITLSMRERLMMDIHDSVSQKIYGLVTLSEAAQAALEAKSNLDFGNLISLIGENARQAVKELRLLLYQMQPIDLEKEGLISVLHHRLAAVEGRADIKARFLADEELHISKRKEIALYYIAQEALNNVLRHARAKSVSVILRQENKNVMLEVSDDGCGFAIDDLGEGGMGLKNIKERVKQENGKLKISSEPETGTIIKVSFDMDPDENSKSVIG